MSQDIFHQLGRACRAFLEIFPKGRQADFEKKSREIFRLAQQLQESHLQREVSELIKQVEQFLLRPDEELSREIAKRALHLEQETREI